MSLIQTNVGIDTSQVSLKQTDFKINKNPLSLIQTDVGIDTNPASRLQTDFGIDTNPVSLVQADFGLDTISSVHVSLVRISCRHLVLLPTSFITEQCVPQYQKTMIMSTKTSEDPCVFICVNR